MTPTSIRNSMKNRSKNNVCSKLFFGLPFFIFFLIFFKNCRFWDPLRNPMGSKMVPKSSKWCHKSQISSPMQHLFVKAWFSRNHSNPCAVGTSCFKKHHFFDDDWLLFRFVCFSLCYVLYVIFITFVEKTSANAQPLSPPIFEKIAPDFKNNVFSYFASLRLRFL